jgi:4a-hydroxytetrahydrobiopterin dehydratase
MMLKERISKDLKSKTYEFSPKILKQVESEELHKQIHEDWRLVNGHHLERIFTTKDFKDSLILTNKIGILAEDDNHRPDIYLSQGKVKVILFTHKIGGLSKNDFILASKIDYITL